MAAAADVEHQPVNAIGRGIGRITGATVAQPLQPVLIGMGIGFENAQVRFARARVGQSHARRQADRQPVGVDAPQPHRAADHVHHHRRPFARGPEIRPRDPQPIDRQEGEAQRQITARQRLPDPLHRHGVHRPHLQNIVFLCPTPAATLARPVPPGGAAG